MQRFLTFTFMRLGMHPARAGITAYFLQIAIVAVLTGFAGLYFLTR